MRIVRAAERVRRRGRRREARGGVGVRRRHHAGRAVRRARPPHRGAGARRRARQRRAPLRARLLDPAPPPEGARGGAGARRSTPEVRELVTESAVALAAHVGYVNAGTVEFLLDADDRRGLLPRDEHPAPGRAPGHRAASPGTRPGRSSSCASPPGEPLPFGQDDVALHGPRDRGAGLRRGPVRTASCRRPAPPTHRALAGARPGRRRPRVRPGRQHVVRPDARQGHRARPGPRGRPPRAGRRARRHRDPRADHQRRLPARAGRERRVPRRRPSTPPGSTSATRRAADRDAARVFAAWTSAMLVADVDQRAPVPAPTAGAPAPTPRRSSVELDETVARRPRRAAGSATTTVRQVELLAERHVVVLDRRRPPRAGGRQRRSRTSSRSCTGASASSSSAPTSSATTAPPPATARSSPRCPAPSSTSASTAGERGRRGRRARRDGGDEDGARAQGAVRRHRRRGRRRRRRRRSRSAPRCSWSSPRRTTTDAHAAASSRLTGAARAGHDLRGRPARRAAERVGARADRGQGRVHPPAGRRRAADRRGDQLRAPEVGAPARRRRPS